MSATEAVPYVAQRQHRGCDLCGETINIGEKCLRWKCFSDGSAMSVRVHASCHAEAQRYEWFADPDGWPELYPLVEQRSQNTHTPPRAGTEDR